MDKSNVAPEIPDVKISNSNPAAPPNKTAVTDLVPTSKPSIASSVKPAVRHRHRAKPKVVTFDGSPEVSGGELAVQKNDGELFSIMGFSITKIHIYVLVLVIGVAGYFLWTWYSKRKELKGNIERMNREDDDYSDYPVMPRMTQQQYIAYNRMMQNMAQEQSPRQNPMYAPQRPPQARREQVMDQERDQDQSIEPYRSSPVPSHPVQQTNDSPQQQAPSGQQQPPAPSHQQPLMPPQETYNQQQFVAPPNPNGQNHNGQPTEYNAPSQVQLPQ